MGGGEDVSPGDHGAAAELLEGGAVDEGCHPRPVLHRGGRRLRHAGHVLAVATAHCKHAETCQTDRNLASFGREPRSWHRFKGKQSVREIYVINLKFTRSPFKNCTLSVAMGLTGLKAQRNISNERYSGRFPVCLFVCLHG